MGHGGRGGAGKMEVGWGGWGWGRGGWGGVGRGGWGWGGARREHSSGMNHLLPGVLRAWPSSLPWWVVVCNVVILSAITAFGFQLTLLAHSCFKDWSHCSKIAMTTAGTIFQS